MDLENIYYADKPMCDYLARKLSFRYLIKVIDRYISIQLYKNVNNIKSISSSRRDLIMKRKYKQLIKKYNLESRWEDL